MSLTKCFLSAELGKHPLGACFLVPCMSTLQTLALFAPVNRLLFATSTKAEHLCQCHQCSHTCSVSINSSPSQSRLGKYFLLECLSNVEKLFQRCCMGNIKKLELKPEPALCSAHSLRPHLSDQR